MPRYTYHCEECEVTYQKTHSIKEKLTDCEECDATSALKRIPSVSYVFSDTKTAGQLVKKHIEDVKKEVEEEKEVLRKAEYK